jgi:anthranilate synthase/aminodeoxychorismate synthase-like glutamine amidotransferase
MILVLDNYDSFTYNLVQYIGQFRADIDVLRNDAFTLASIRRRPPERIIISPGPGYPEDAGLSVALVRELGSTVPILGICLGHQAVAAAYGGRIIRAPEVCHGKTSEIVHEGGLIFEGIPSPFQATRYHSLVVEPDTLPEELQVIAWTKGGLIMGLKHRTHPVVGLQFHPESILTDHGLRIVENFLTEYS